ncbi:hypothetical protein EX30DRAFT_241770 [Ascodesmis nigricans]|uniref:Uncharacterized protein n=1 Tax=Ascodesmis nigricans TaxID=341454 RepID=A0A4S2MZ55_9PEZI|nr:hypothetical protein EX30DRAFT_241770 [Ascodesmis nigricans]
MKRRMLPHFSWVTMGKRDTLVSEQRSHRVRRRGQSCVRPKDTTVHFASSLARVETTLILTFDTNARVWGNRPRGYGNCFLQPPCAIPWRCQHASARRKYSYSQQRRGMSLMLRTVRGNLCEAKNFFIISNDWRAISASTSLSSSPTVDDEKGHFLIGSKMRGKIVEITTN